MHVVVDEGFGDAVASIVAELRGRGHAVHTVADAREPDAVVRMMGRHGVVISLSKSLLVRTATVLGRDSAGPTQRRFAAPVIVGIKNGRNTAQFVHHDDVARCVADAVEHPDWTGTVDLAASDTIALREVAAILNKRYVEVSRRRAPQDLPLPDTSRLDELGFVPAWTSRDCVLDFRMANRQHIYLGSKRVGLPWRFQWVCSPEPPRETRRHPASGKAGEFDTAIDPQWPVYTAVNTSEAFPGPMTPLSLELSLEGMRAMGVQAVHQLRLNGELRRAVIEEQTGSFGHRIYANLSVLFATSSALPGADRSGWGDKLFGAGSGAVLPEADKIGWWGMAWRLPRMLTFIVSAAAETRLMDNEARAGQHGAPHYAGLADEQLHSQLRCTHDEVVSAWGLAALITLAVVPVLGVIERIAGRTLANESKSGTEKLASAGLSTGTHQLAADLRADASIARTPRFAAKLDNVIAEWGHRGPGETELINPVFADNPARLLDVVTKLAGATEHASTPRPKLNPLLRLLAWESAWFQQSRERARDAAIRLTHEYRLIVREIGTRLVNAGTIEDRDDVFYLTRDELLHPPLDVRYLVLRRQAERARLVREKPPTEFTRRWEPEVDRAPEIQAGETLTGIPVSAGIIKGRVRVVTADSINELKPGEVLVAESLDVGWTPFFSYAAAVIVDTGATMSHAAIVAREFGIPCVVGSKTGSRVLRTGHLVEVDGTSGRVRRVE